VRARGPSVWARSRSASPTAFRARLVSPTRFACECLSRKPFMETVASRSRHKCTRTGGRSFANRHADPRENNDSTWKGDSQESRKNWEPDAASIVKGKENSIPLGWIRFRIRVGESSNGASLFRLFRVFLRDQSRELAHGLFIARRDVHLDRFSAPRTSRDSRCVKFPKYSKLHPGGGRCSSVNSRLPATTRNGRRRSNPRNST